MRKGMLALVVAALAGGLWWWQGRTAKPLTLQEVAHRLAAPVPAPDGPVAVYHLGHSLVGRDMPAMLAQLAPPGHRYDSQLGWGTTLQAHWGDAPINGFDDDNSILYDGSGGLADGMRRAIALPPAAYARMQRRLQQDAAAL
ncbi:MAG: hypothetical protein ACK4VZ_08500, partial [Paracoccaceae bacterium]